MTLGPQFIPAARIAVLILGDGLLARHQRPVPSRESRVQEEGLIAFRRCFYVIHRLVAKSIGKVVVRLVAEHGDRSVITGKRGRIEITGRAGNDSVVVIEATLQRPIMLADGQRCQVPLTYHQGVITRRLQGLGDCDAAAAQIPGVGPVRVALAVRDHHPHARLVRVEAGHERGAGRGSSADYCENR